MQIRLLSSLWKSKEVFLNAISNYLYILYFKKEIELVFFITCFSFTYKH